MKKFLLLVVVLMTTLAASAQEMYMGCLLYTSPSPRD